MSFSSILIHRDVPVINGFAQVAPCRDSERTKTTEVAAIAAVPGAYTVRLSMGSGRPRGSKCGQQEFIRIPGIAPDRWYSSDPIAAMGGDVL